MQSDQAFQLYLTALIKSNGADSIDHAVKRREQVLGLLTTSLGSTSNGSHTQASPSIVSDASSAQPSTNNPTNLPQESLSRSQQVAQAVLATKLLSSSSYSNPGTLLGDKLFAAQNSQSSALGVPGGGKENPIFVTVSERKDY